MPRVLYDPPLENKKWSVIFLRDVIHFMKGREIEETLKYMADHLNDDGVLFLTYVNQAHLEDNFKSYLQNFQKEYEKTNPY